MPLCTMDQRPDMSWGRDNGQALLNGAFISAQEVTNCLGCKPQGGSLSTSSAPRTPANEPPVTGQKTEAAAASHP